ncbi:MAG: histidine kinase, partial [Rhodocyclaceae bacterium]|nr:histidine kinase [Rhodocyclaceae bacterium]
SSFAQSLRDSVLFRVGLAMGALALTSFASIAISTVIADDISGRANAVNVSGSLRFLTFRTLSELLQPEKRPQALATIEIFEERLLGLERFVVAKAPQGAPSVVAVRGVLDRWNTHFRALETNAARGEFAALKQVAEEIPDYVDQINHVVHLIEMELEDKARLLHVIQLALLACIVLISLLTLWMLRRQVILPLAQLLLAAKTVTQGSFSVRVSHVSSDELGQLGRAFNAMVAEIASMYAHLADKVEEKTQELTRTNQSLELLYRISQQLSASDLTLDTVQAAMRDVEAALELGHSMICISENGQLPAHVVTGDLTAEELHVLCGQPDCGWCFARAEEAFARQTQSLPMVAVPIGDGDRLRGILPILINPAHPLTHDKARILQTVGLHVSNALINMRRAEEKHRLAVLEERSVIARELHDSIAQSLSYLQIQVTRLEKSFERGGDSRAIAAELKRGLNGTYRELRELIVTFRLRIDARGFNAALQDTVAEFSNKLGFPVRLGNALSGIALSGNEEMHVIRIIREALSNIEHHAAAQSANVNIAVDADHAVTVQIADDGRGFDAHQTPTNHFGVSIMHDRAQILDGRLEIETAPGAGAVVTLHFLPQSYRQPTQSAQ